MRALVTGGTGQLGSDLADLLGDRAHVLSHDDLDIADPRALDQAFQRFDPEVVFNCAAFHNVDACENDPLTSWTVNVEAVRQLAVRSRRFVHLSTNYVFDGRRAQPYSEFDLPAPRSMYALTKLAGEHAALAYNDRSLVVRTAGLYGLHGSVSKGGNFVQRMITRAKDQGQLRVVADQYLQPTFTADLAAGLVEAVDRDATGTLHLTASGACSWYEFACAIVEIAGLTVPVEPTATDPAATLVDRPLNGVLERTRAAELGLSPLRPWRDALVDYMRRAGLAAAEVPSAGR